jgi:hypothetical protein
MCVVTRPLRRWYQGMRRPCRNGYLAAKGSGGGRRSLAVENPDRCPQRRAADPTPYGAGGDLDVVISAHPLEFARRLEGAAVGDQSDDGDVHGCPDRGSVSAKGRQQHSPHGAEPVELRLPPRPLSWFVLTVVPPPLRLLPSPLSDETEAPRVTCPEAPLSSSLTSLAHGRTSGHITGSRR